MESYDLGRGIVDVEPDQTIHLGFKQNPIDGSESSYFFQGNNFERFMGEKTQINYYNQLLLLLLFFQQTVSLE